MANNKILIADDEVEVLGILKKKLEENGYNALICATAKDCLEICAKEVPDLILLDIVMPDMNGYQVCSKLKDNPATKNIKVIFTTGQDLEPMSIVQRSQELGAFDFILKPFTIEELFNKIEEVIKGR